MLTDQDLQEMVARFRPIVGIPADPQGMYQALLDLLGENERLKERIEKLTQEVNSLNLRLIAAESKPQDDRRTWEDTPDT